MESRFVILLHETADGSHWDLMLESGDVLLTWRLECDPTTHAQWPIPARRIADHRRAYLEYEGPISGNRGRVRRIAEGVVHFEKTGQTDLVFHLDGKRLSGRFSLPSGDSPGALTLQERPL